MNDWRRFQYYMLIQFNWFKSLFSVWNLWLFKHSYISWYQICSLAPMLSSPERAARRRPRKWTPCSGPLRKSSGNWKRCGLLRWRRMEDNDGKRQPASQHAMRAAQSQDMAFAVRSNFGCKKMWSWIPAPLHRRTSLHYFILWCVALLHCIIVLC